MTVTNQMRMKVMYVDKIISHTAYPQEGNVAKHLRKSLLQLPLFDLGLLSQTMENLSRRIKK